ncbi:MAG: hypothetical protein H0X67_23555, partial [Acidobacteria bacterium]|nr:hypothetical protein [Acidobacteriota bacterium]
MNERLAFGFGPSGRRGEAPGRPAAESHPAEPAHAAEVQPSENSSARRDWAFMGLMAFTALLYFRPQDQLPPLGALRLTEIAALVGLLGLAFNRLGRGLSPTRMTLELAGVVALGLIILALAPFSIWMGGAIGTFTDLYMKVMLIFLLMVNTLNSPKRIEQFT